MLSHKNFLKKTEKYPQLISLVVVVVVVMLTVETPSSSVIVSSASKSPVKLVWEEEWHEEKNLFYICS